MAAVQRSVEIAVNTPSCRISVSELLSFNDETECTQRYSDQEMVQNILAANGDYCGKYNGEEEYVEIWVSAESNYALLLV